MKKILISMVAIVVAVMAFMTTAFAESSKVEIRFAVGDDTLIINGEAVQVEKPYIVGDGVTLVPVRVITEAFGATVGWDQPTETVTLDYPDVKIVLQIDNTVAEVNGKAQTLESAPELTDTGFTMVPLRFISENFGAEVSYDHATAGITVTKDSSNSGTIVEGSVDNAYVGDSFYKWQMETPQDMVMETRYFDGTYTSFVYDKNNWIDIDIYSRADDYDFDESFQTMKAYFKSYTVVVADKDTMADGTPFMHIQAKTQTSYADYYEYATDNYLYCVRSGFTNDDEKLRDEGLRIASTFTLGYGGDVYDLSNAKDGVRPFKVENMKLSFNVPDEYIMLNAEDEETSFMFCSGLPGDDISFIAVEIYSKSSVGDAKKFAQRDYQRNKSYLNEDVTTFAREVSVINYKNITAYQYDYEIDATYIDEYNRDVFFEKGEYVYNFHISVKLPHNSKEAFVNDILNSIVAEELDPNKIGTIIYVDNDHEGTYTVNELNKCEFKLPNDFEALTESKTAVAYSNGSVMLVGSVMMDEDYNYRGIKNVMDRVVAAQRKIDGVTIKELATEKQYGGNKFMSFVYKLNEDDTVSYAEVYVTAANNIAYIFEVIYPEVAYSESARNEAREILASMNFE